VKIRSLDAADSPVSSHSLNFAKSARKGAVLNELCEAKGCF